MSRFVSFLSRFISVCPGLSRPLTALPPPANLARSPPAHARRGEGGEHKKGAEPPPRRLTAPPPSCFSADQRSLRSGRPPFPPRLPPAAPEAARAACGAGGGRGAGRPGECAGSAAWGRRRRRPVRGRGAGAARGVVTSPPHHQRLRCDWLGRGARADWSARGRRARGGGR